MGHGPWPWMDLWSCQEFPLGGSRFLGDGVITEGGLGSSPMESLDVEHGRASGVADMSRS